MVKGELVYTTGKTESGSSFKVEPIRDTQRIRDHLSQDSNYAVYASACLDPSYRKASSWWLSQGREKSAIVLHCRGTLGPSFFAMGDPEALEAVVSLHPGARAAFATFQTEHLPVIERYFIIQNGHTMQRMVVSKETFRPAEGATKRIYGADIGLVNRLYSSEGSYYSARHLDESVYYATLENDRVVSMAGTHIVAPNEGIAVVGNVYTHPRYRGRGYATQATSAVTAELLETCPLVALTVDPKNLPAVRAYEKLGYRAEGSLMESMTYRKDLIGVGSFVRRLLAKKETV